MTPSSEGGLQLPVRRLGMEHVPEVTRVLCEAFADYPVIRHVLREETLLGIPEGAGLGAAALVSKPDNSEVPATFASLRERVWDELGPEARARYEAFGSAWSGFTVDVPHLHLNMIGVDPGSQSRGLGRALLEHVQRMSQDDGTSRGVTLTTEVLSNVGLYEHFGYEVMWHGQVAPGLQSWGLFRANQL